MDVDATDLLILQELEAAIAQSDDPDAQIRSINELKKLAKTPPLSPFTFKILSVLKKFLATSRIPRSESKIDDVVVLAASCALWSYTWLKLEYQTNVELDDACVDILPDALRWIDFLHARYFGDDWQGRRFGENIWGAALTFLDMSVGHYRMFSMAGENITRQIVHFWVQEARLDNRLYVKHLPSRILQKLIVCHGEEREDLIVSAMESVGASVAARTAVSQLSTITGTDSDKHLMETRNETLLIRILACNGTLVHHLLAMGAIRVLVKTLAYATRESYTDDPSTRGIMIWIVQNICEALQVAIGQTTGVAFARQVLSFGILAPLLRADKWHKHLTPKHFPGAPYIHVGLLIQILATYTIYPSVLHSAVVAIEEVPVKLQNRLDKAGPMTSAWKTFKNVVESRSKIPGAPPRPFDISRCSNLSCSARGTRNTESKRCAGCGDALYCGPACQKVDWQNHRNTCRELQALTFGASQAILRYYLHNVGL
ncbi:hypothetical protein FB45DRAFT_366128 [Roridomyces roridus]|uniref:MYND-type domain-containing protein n=1 Tax=Roridomyces roridus TaxID=1738132 RepID=A0AAD7FW77_9AGAR|nr:hypothetical protein FB45DRAFT_366128 [Roridomyces roridus]